MVDPFKLGQQKQGLMANSPPVNGVNQGGFPTNAVQQPSGFGGQQPAFSAGLGFGIGGDVGQQQQQLLTPQSAALQQQQAALQFQQQHQNAQCCGICIFVGLRVRFLFQQSQ